MSLSIPAALGAVLAVTLLQLTPAAAHDERHPLEAPAELDVSVLARVNGVAITGEDFRAAFDTLAVESQLPARSNPKLLVQALVRRELMRQAAIRAGLDRDPGVQRKIERLTRDLLATEMMNRERARAADVGDEQVRRYYDENAGIFTLREKISASHILVATREEAERLRAGLSAGADFAELAREHSLDRKTKGLGGRIFSIARGQMSPEFEAVAFALEPGQLSAVVQDRDGYHVILLHERVPASRVPFVKDKVRQRLVHERAQQRVKELVERLEREATIQLYEDALAGIR